MGAVTAVVISLTGQLITTAVDSVLSNTSLGWSLTDGALLLLPILDTNDSDNSLSFELVLTLEALLAAQWLNSKSQSKTNQFHWFEPEVEKVRNRELETKHYSVLSLENQNTYKLLPCRRCINRCITKTIRNCRQTNIFLKSFVSLGLFRRQTNKISGRMIASRYELPRKAYFANQLSPWRQYSFFRWHI
jgi:hypothetical protein